MEEPILTRFDPQDQPIVSLTLSSPGLTGAELTRMADPVTRQVPIYVSIPNVGGRLVAGLFAEGRVVSQSADGLVVPLNAVNTASGMPWVLRANGGRTERVDVRLGLQDPRSERVQVVAGLNEGDMLLRGAAQGITPGTPVSLNGSP